MKRIGLLLAFFGFMFLVLPSVPAQDEKKKDADKADAKKDDAKKSDEPEKKKKEDEPKKEKLTYGTKFVSKIISANGASGREFTVELKDIDPKKQQDAQVWSAQQMQQLSQQLAQATQQYSQAIKGAKKPQDFINAQTNYAKAQANYQNSLYKFQMEAAKKDIYSTKPYDVRASDDAKVRSNILPVEFDDLGFEKKWTKKEIEERKDKTGWPGYFPSDFDQLKSGQYVEVYMAKVAPPAKDKDQPKKKKGPDDDPPPPEMKGRPEFVLIVILQQPAQPK